MQNRVNRNHPALKHGAYAATAVLPGERPADFEKLHRHLIAEYAPSGVHEEHIVMNMARLIWRQQNLGPCAFKNLPRTVGRKFRQSEKKSLCTKIG
jgi:hypothetical protein